MLQKLSQMSGKKKRKLMNKRKTMKLIILLCSAMFALLPHSGIAEESLESAIQAYVSKFGHSDQDYLMYIPIDLGGKSKNSVLLTFSSGYYDKSQGYMWAALFFEDGEWKEPKTREFNGNVIKFSAISFDPASAGAAYLQKFKRNGLLACFPRLGAWSFTYLDSKDDTLKTVWFAKASEVDLTEDQLVNLRDAGALSIQWKAVP